MRIKRALVLVLAFMMIFLCGCQVKEENNNESVKDEETKIQIGMSFDSFVIERWQRDRDIFVSLAKDMGADVNVQNANGDINEQIKQIEYFIEKGMDAIVVICIDSDSLTDVVKKAKDAGIKVVAYDRLLHNSDVDLYISFDNNEVGELMGEALIDNGLAGGNVIMIGGNMADDNVHQVEEGFINVMDKNSVQVIGSMHAEGWRAELGGEYVYNNLDLIDEADAIMCGNDNIATMVVHALAENRKADNMLVVGQDADLEACQRIIEGTQTMTVYKPVEKLAARAAECTIALVKGEQLAGDDVRTINDGKYDVPYVKLKPIAVTADNMDEVIINSGFHLQEDVYLHTPSKEAIEVKVGSLKGATSLGLLNLMDKSKNKQAVGDYEFSIATAADEILPRMIKGELDIALIPANAAANLYQKSNKAIQVIDINTLGVLYVVTGDESIQSVEDLKGKTIYSTGKGVTPEAAIMSVLEGSGLSADDYTVEFKSEATEVVALLAQNPDAVGVLPQPFVTAATMQNENLKVVLDLSEEWNNIYGSDGARMVTGVTVVRKEFASQHPDAVKTFLLEHNESVRLANTDVDNTARLAVEAEIIAKEPIAKKAIPFCNIVCITDNEMKSALAGYLESLYDFNPELIGGATPEDDFYYVK